MILFKYDFKNCRSSPYNNILEQPYHTHVISEPIRPSRRPYRSVSGGVCEEAWVNRIGEHMLLEEPTLAGSCVSQLTLTAIIS